MQMQLKDIVLLPLMRDLLVQLQDQQAQDLIAQAIRRIEVIGALVPPTRKSTP
jgi:hypothetical protein